MAEAGGLSQDENVDEGTWLLQSREIFVGIRLYWNFAIAWDKVRMSNVSLDVSVMESICFVKNEVVAREVLTGLPFSPISGERPGGKCQTWRVERIDRLDIDRRK